MPQFNRFTIKAQEALHNAQEHAAEHNHGELKALHLLHALIEEENSLVQPTLQRLGVDLDRLHDAIEDQLALLPKMVAVSNVGQLYLSQELMKILDVAAKVAANQKD